jgi:hypothetical protein
MLSPFPLPLPPLFFPVLPLAALFQCNPYRPFLLFYPLSSSRHRFRQWVHHHLGESHHHLEEISSSPGGVSSSVGVVDHHPLHHHRHHHRLHNTSVILSPFPLPLPPLFAVLPPCRGNLSTFTLSIIIVIVIIIISDSVVVTYVVTFARVTLLETFAIGAIVISHQNSEGLFALLLLSLALSLLLYLLLKLLNFSQMAEYTLWFLGNEVSVSFRCYEPVASATISIFSGRSWCNWSSWCNWWFHWGWCHSRDDHWLVNRSCGWRQDWRWNRSWRTGWGWTT